MVVVNQFFISQGSKSGDTLILTPEESHHLRDVQRHKANETIQVTDGKKSFFAQIMTLTKYEVIIRLMSEVITPEKKGSITLAQALLKGDGIEWVLEKSVELGVDFIQPFTSKRTIVESESPNKRQRWEKIMDAAVKQCGTPTRPILKTTLPFEKVLENSSELKIIFWEEGGISLKDFLKRNLFILQHTSRH
ncbi:MAG: 16S rRNA (uracil(1498)-N(3))-methyltransferase [Deltaproteobacteria bacterium]|nr:MAG: 16S rRNA (uracil(1498)-N(3))-methyltransferase [Deltaproteobacteria bacterium]